MRKFILIFLLILISSTLNAQVVGTMIRGVQKDGISTKFVLVNDDGSINTDLLQTAIASVTWAVNTITINA